jgi:hypothetical protein
MGRVQAARAGGVGHRRYAGGVLKPLIPADEEQRLADLARLELMHTAPEEGFDRVTAELAALFGVPVATMSLVDRDVLFFKSQ